MPKGGGGGGVTNKQRYKLNRQKRGHSPETPSPSPQLNKRQHLQYGRNPPEFPIRNPNLGSRKTSTFACKLYLLNDGPTLRAPLSGTFLQRKDVVNQCLESDLTRNRKPEEGQRMTTTTATAVSKVPTEATNFPFPWPEDKAVGHQRCRQARSAQCQGSDAGFRGFGGQAIDQRQQRKRKSTTRPSLAVLSRWVSWVQLSKALSAADSRHCHSARYSRRGSFPEEHSRTSVG